MRIIIRGVSEFPKCCAFWELRGIGELYIHKQHKAFEMLAGTTNDMLSEIYNDKKFHRDLMKTNSPLVYVIFILTILFVDLALGGEPHKSLFFCFCCFIMREFRLCSIPLSHHGKPI